MNINLNETQHQTIVDALITCMDHVKHDQQLVLNALAHVQDQAADQHHLSRLMSFHMPAPAGVADMINRACDAG